MKVNVRGLEVFVESMDELQQLIDRFGADDASDEPAKKSTGALSGNGGSGNGHLNSVAHDKVILQTLVNAGETGVHTNTLGDMLGRKGKAVANSLLQWSVKTRLVQDESNNPFEKARPGGGRGWKLKSTMLPIARQLLQEMK